MHLIPTHLLIPDHVAAHAAVIPVAFALLIYSAGFLVDGAVGIANRTGLPKIIIGIVVVGLGTTAPELAVSVAAALSGAPDLALGNAVGSVIVDDGAAIGLGMVVAPAAVAINPRIMRSVGVFVPAAGAAAFLMALNGTVGRSEGAILLAVYVVYMVVLIVTHRRQGAAEETPSEDADLAEHVKPGGTARQVLRLAAGLAGVLVASELLVPSARFIAGEFGVPEAIIGLTIVAIGTSLPEIATCVSASRKGHGDLAFGDILGADILNVLWIIGASALVNPISVERRVVLFSFPWMFVVVGAMLGLVWMGYSLRRWKGVVLLALFAVYLASTIILFYLQ